MDPFNPINVDKDVVQSDLEITSNISERNEAYDQINEAQQQQRQQILDESKPLEGTGSELGNAIAGGLVDAVSDIVTLPERVIDLATGEMAEEGVDYKPEWDDWLEPEKYETRTWWGGMIKGTVNLATLLIPIGGQVRGAGMFARFGPKAATILRGATSGAIADGIMRSSQGDNLSATAIEHVPQLEAVLGPLATRDTDHPAMRILKNVVEGMGIGIIFDGLVGLKGAKSVDEVSDQLALPPSRINLDTPEVKDMMRRADEARRTLETLQTRDVTPERTARIESLNTTIQQLDNEIATFTDPSTAKAETLRRNTDVRDQTIEKGKDELKSPSFGEHKNKPIAERHQGTPNSRNAPSKVLKQLDDIDSLSDAADGSTDSVISAMQAQRMSQTADMSVSEMKKLAKGLISDNRIEAELKKFKGSKTPWRDSFPKAFQRMQRVMDGRNTSEMSASKFWDQFDKTMQYKNRGINERYLNEEDLLAADLVIGSLFKQMRDLGIASRELAGNVNLKDGTGPLKTVTDRIVVGLTEVKKSRYLRGLALGELNISPKEASQRIADIHKEAKDSVKMMQELMVNDPSDNVMKSFIEYFSMASKVDNWTDLDNFLRSKIRGGEFNGKKIEGAITKEMSGLMVHSILSGPKTPVRAILGTSIASTSRSIAQSVGGVIRLPFTGDIATARSSIASTTAMIQAVPEAFEVFKTKLKGYWSGDVATMKSRYSDYTKRDEEWASLQFWTETRGTDADKAAFNVANMAREMNSNSFLTYSTKIMAATDDAFQVLIARSRAREKAVRQALEEAGPGQINIDKKVMKRQEELFYRDLLDEEGNINPESDVFFKSVVEEATLTTDISGFSGALDNAFKQSPWLRPFFLFARTGVNGLALTAKSTPILNLVLDKQRAILTATADNLGSVQKYGITTASDLANEQALMAGRQAIGASVIFMAGQKFQAGEITGNGPTNRRLRKAWMDAGWQPNSIKLGDTWVNYQAFEPFNTILTAVADFGTNQQLMGDEWTQNGLMSLVSIIADTATSKSYLSTLNDFVDMFSGSPDKINTVIGNLANNTIPLGGLRNEIGKLISPGMREVNRTIIEQVRNRNQFMEPLAGDGALPIKYDWLSGEPIRDYDYMTRMWNFFSPVQMNPEVGPGRNLLFESQFNVVQTFESVDGVNLEDHPEVRSMLQYEMGQEGLDDELTLLASRSDVQASLELMRRDIASGKDLDPMNAYLHNDLINNLIKGAKRRAWARIRNRPEVRQIITEQKDAAREERQTRRNSSSYSKLLNMPK